jgi:hypothetical protein
MAQTLYVYRDSKGVDHTIGIRDIPNGIQLVLSLDDLDAMTKDMTVMLGPHPRGTSVIVPLCDQALAQAIPAHPPAAAPTPATAPTPPPTFEAKSRTSLNPGTLVRWDGPAHQYVCPTTENVEACGVVVKCDPGFLDWYVTVEPLRA